MKTLINFPLYSKDVIETSSSQKVSLLFLVSLLRNFIKPVFVNETQRGVE